MNFEVDPIPDILDRENPRITTDLRSGVKMLKVDPIEPCPVGSYIIKVFQVTEYQQDCDGSLMAILENVDTRGELTGWGVSSIGLGPETTWVVKNFPMS